MRELKPKRINPQVPPQARPDSAPEDPMAHRRWRRRLRVFQIGLLVFFVAVALRLVQIQIVESEKFVKLAERQYRKSDPIPALRGSLLDRHGRPIATSTPYLTIEANPRNVGSDDTVLAKSLSKITGKPWRRYLAQLNIEDKEARKKAEKASKGVKTVKAARDKKTGKPAKKRYLKQYALLERSLDPGPVDACRLDTLRGLTITPKSGRIYHTGVIAGQLLGTTAFGDSGIAGIELGFDSLLSGTDGYTIVQLDGAGRPRPAIDYPQVDPIPGSSLVLTIDLNFQEIAENELERGVKANKAEGGVVVMLDPRTGEVLAVAQYPRVDPAEFGRAALEDQKLRAVTDMVEPGSVFKLVTAAAALDNGLIRPEKTFYAEQGTYLVHYKGLKKPRKIKDVHEYGYLTFRESMEFSSNIVMAKVSDIIGNERLYRMARDFGFGMKTGVNIPAEIGGRLKNPNDWSATSRNTIAYGYEVGVTPMQIAAAYAAIANGGILMRPFLLKKEIGPDSAVIRETEPAPVRRVVTEETAATLTSFLEGVVERGTAVTAKIPGLRIAGKTGTSKRLVDGRYAESEYTASFVGYFPAEDPRVVCLVMLDKPQGISRYGGTTSAPIFREIVSRIMASSPDFAQPASLPVADAASAGAPGSVDARANMPKPAAPARTNREKKSSSDAGRPLVPDVIGYSIRKALSVLRDEKFQPVVNGSGVVVSQHPAPGEPVTPNRVVRLTCAPRDTRLGGLR